MVGDAKVLNIRAKGQLMAKVWGRQSNSLGKHQELKHSECMCAQSEIWIHFCEWMSSSL